MPKITNENEEKRRLARAVIDGWLTRNGISRYNFGKFLGMCQQSGYKRYHDPRYLTAEDISKMRRARYPLEDQEVLVITK